MPSARVKTDVAGTCSEPRLAQGPGQRCRPAEKAGAAVNDPRCRADLGSPSHHRRAEGYQAAAAARGGSGQFLRVEPAETPADQTDPPSQAREKTQ